MVGKTRNQKPMLTLRTETIMNKHDKNMYILQSSIYQDIYKKNETQFQRITTQEIKNTGIGEVVTYICLSCYMDTRKSTSRS